MASKRSQCSGEQKEGENGIGRKENGRDGDWKAGAVRWTSETARAVE